MNKKAPFYLGVTCRKVIGGKNPLWHAYMKDTVSIYVGAGNTADNAIRDLQKQLRDTK